jgi:hypothetical protein
LVPSLTGEARQLLLIGRIRDALIRAVGIRKHSQSPYSHIEHSFNTSHLGAWVRTGHGANNYAELTYQALFPHFSWMESQTLV